MSESLVPLHPNIKLGHPELAEAGRCLDCARPVSTYAAGDRLVVIHEGNMCSGFAKRFTPNENNPSPSEGWDQTGETTRKAPVARERGNRLEPPR
jgi:hypothetical protein